jgi:Protein of unknown function (DUF4238)
MLHTIDLAGATPTLTEAPVSRTLGMTDMYRDFTHATNQHYLERQLSQLESNAGRIISTVRKAFEAGQQEVWITRVDRDILRKFLFIMKYRGSSARKRFYHQNAESYSEDDKEELQKYMREKGFKRPIDVWFDNIKAILELKMDIKREWMEVIKKRAYPGDAMMFISNTQMMYLALCTPSGQGEFLLTENAYSIHEGPVSFSISPHTGESAMKSYTEFHIFAVISPRLIMVLRSFLLPVIEEDSNDDIRQWRETMFHLNARQHSDPQSANSILDDLPVTKARNSYMRRIDGKLELLSGEDGSLRPNHKFCFRFFPISHKHVNKINCILLEQSYTISTIVSKSQLELRKTLEYYLSIPCEQNTANGVESCGFKAVGDTPNDPRLVFLRKLEQVARQLGSNATAVYRVQRTKLNEEEMFERLGQILAKSLSKKPNKTMRLYMKLGQLVTAKEKEY